MKPRKPTTPRRHGTWRSPYLALALFALGAFPAPPAGGEAAEHAAPALPAQTSLGAERAGPIPLYAPRELVERFRAGRVVFVDVREPEEYAENHLPGAIHIPERALPARRDELPANTLLIPYCNMDFRGLLAARQLRRLGFAEVGLMQERGLVGWRAQGLPIAGTESGLDDTAARARLAQIPLASLAPAHTPHRYPPTGRVLRVAMEVANWYFDPNTLEVEAGDTVEIDLVSTEGDHTLIVPAFELATRIAAGQHQRLRFVADQVGDHRFGSCEWDGKALHVMKGRLRVHPPRATESSTSSPFETHPAGEDLRNTARAPRGLSR